MTTTCTVDHGGRPCPYDPRLAALAIAREELAALEHEQWAAWATVLMATEKISPERRSRWTALLGGYDELTEEMKDHDRKWADRSIAAILAKLPPDWCGHEAEFADYRDWASNEIARLREEMERIAVAVTTWPLPPNRTEVGILLRAALAGGSE